MNKDDVKIEDRKDGLDDLPTYDPKRDLERYCYPTLYLLKQQNNYNTTTSIVSMESLLSSEMFCDSKMELPCAIGKDNHNEVFMFDLVKAPHLLVNGDVGRGKTNCLYTIITSLLYKMHPAELKMLLIGTKKDELSVFNPLINHFLAVVPDKNCSPIISDATKVELTLNSLCKFMDQRRELLKEVSARNIKEYNKKFTDRMIPPRGGHGYMPYLAVVIDDYDDLVLKAGKQIESQITRIVHLGHIVGIHLIITTDCVDNSIISESLLKNFHTCITFRSNSYLTCFVDGPEEIQVQSAYIDISELKEINDYIRVQQSYYCPYELPEYAIFEDIIFNKDEKIHTIRTSNRDETINQLSTLARKYGKGIKIADSYGWAPGDFGGILTSLEKGDLLVAYHLEFIDYYALEYLKTAIYNSKIYIYLDKDSNKRIEMDINPFTFVVLEDENSPIPDFIKAFLSPNNIERSLSIDSEEIIHYDLSCIKIKANNNYDFGPNLNVMFITDENSKQWKMDDLNKMVFNTIIEHPINQVHVTFVDLNFLGGYAELTKHLDKKLYGDIVSTNNQLGSLLDSLKERMVAILQEYGDIREYQQKNKVYKYPYEVIVLLNDIPKESPYYAPFMALLKQGNKGGVYFFLLHENGDGGQDAYTNNLNDSLTIYNSPDWYAESVISHNSLYYKHYYWDNEKYRQAIFDYIQEEVDKKPVSTVQAINIKDLINTPYAPVENTIEIPVGVDEKANVNFRMDTTSHVHSFIIGQSGSGKSVFLHNVIMGAIAKYAPEDLQLYLLDFKLGGVEFNRYRDVKHLKALLVDNSDIQITLEILRDLSEAMKQRGRMLRDQGVSNIGEYNQRNPDNRMPQIILVADECHEMFNPHGNKDRKQFNEIATILAKIAKEGRSQGVHMVLATQTLAQTEISNEILNNITDHYLLKCAPGDSECMVRDSSDITATLKTGDVYYHHVEHQTQFRSNYISKEDSDDLISQIVAKTESCQSNGQFYFSGSQVFRIDNALVNLLAEKGGKNPVAAIGRGISLKNESLNIVLRKDDGENIMLVGIDDEQQVTRTTMDVLCSLMLSSHRKETNVKYCVINCLNDEDSKYAGLLEDMADQGLITLLNKRKRGKFLYDLAIDIKNDEARRTVLVILGQEKFRELKLDEDIELEDSGASAPADNANPFGALSFGSPSSSTVDSKFNTFKKALAYIMDEGPAQGVHTILQIDKPDKFLYEDYVSSKMLLLKFNHMVILRSEEKVAMTLGLQEDIRPENLSSDTERLRAFYFATMNDEYKLFTPYDGVEDGLMNNL